MPGRSGHSGSGGWVSSSGTSSLPASPSYDSPRTTGSPPEYKATVSIEFLPGFESGEVDAFEAYITTDDGSSGSGDQGYASGGYRYGFNGKENDDETGTQDYGMRIYDPRMGRFLSTDPLTKGYPQLTPYQFSSNTPIATIDLDGLESMIPLNGVGASGTPLSNYFDNSEGRKNWSKGMGIGLATGGAVLTDIFLTKGWLTRTLLMSQGLGLLEHNRGKTPEEKAAQDARIKENAADFAINLSSGFLLSKGIRAAGMLLSEGRRLYNFGARALGEMGEEALARQYGTIKPKGKGSTLNTSDGPRKPDGIPAGTTINSTDKLFEAKVGLQKYSGEVAREVAKDAELIASGKIDEITWVFYRSPTTGKIGASDELLTELRKAGIRTEMAGDLPKDIVDKAVKKYGATIKK
jgi:RHS repeat-associated protein